MNDFELNKAIVEALRLRVKGRSFSGDGLLYLLMERIPLAIT